MSTECSNTATHIETFVTGKIPAKSEIQTLWQMASTGRAWCDFVSYDPRMPENMRLYVRRIERDHARCAELETEVGRFLVEVEKTVASLNARYNVIGDLSDFVTPQRVALLAAG